MLAAFAPDVRRFVAGFRRESNDRFALVAGMLANSVFGVIRIAIMLAVVEAPRVSD